MSTRCQLDVNYNYPKLYIIITFRQEISKLYIKQKYQALINRMEQANAFCKLYLVKKISRREYIILFSGVL